MTENYYKILNISTSASVQEIKGAYRKLVLKYHPDKNNNDDVYFRKIRMAYETLVDPLKRKRYHMLLAGSLNKNIFNAQLHTQKAYEIIKIELDKRVLNLDEILSVQITSKVHGTDFVLQGLFQFDILEGPIFFKSKINEQAVQIRYLLKPKYPGYLSVGPASCLIQNTRIESEHWFVKANMPGFVSSRKKNDKFEKIAARLAWSFLLLMGAMVFFSIISSQNSKQSPIASSNPFNTHKSNLLPPYNIFLKDQQVVNINSENKITFQNKKDKEAIVFLVNHENQNIIRHQYLSENENLEMKNIPDGIYYLMVYFGKYWNENKMVNQNKWKGGFEEAEEFIKFNDENDWLKMMQIQSEDSIKYSHYYIWLNPDSQGKVKPNEQYQHIIF